MSTNTGFGTMAAAPVRIMGADAGANPGGGLPVSPPADIEHSHVDGVYTAASTVLVASGAARIDRIHIWTQGEVVVALTCSGVTKWKLQFGADYTRMYAGPENVPLGGGGDITLSLAYVSGGGDVNVFLSYV